MTYQETLDYIYSQVPMFQNRGAGAYKPGLDNTLALAARWGNPHKRLRAAIHVGGTNGKGSTAHTLAAVLQSAGYKVGLYTSPHLVDFRERIRINGQMVPQDYVVSFVEQYLAEPELTQLHPTFFELSTIMALNWFAEADVDVAVIEVGLGGRLDCTNIISPVLSVITNISLDHTALLGSTEEAIAREKAGIIKPGVPVVIGSAEGAVRRVFEDAARTVGAPVIFAADTHIYKEATLEGDCIRYSGTPWGTVTGELCGDCQPENARTVMFALEILQKEFPAINAEAVRCGFADVCGLTGLMGRWMTLQREPVHVVCDTGHNIGGWRHLGHRLCREAAIAPLHVVLGFVNDKDVTAILETLPRNATYYFATPSVERGRPAAETAAIAGAAGLNGVAYPSVAEAYNAALVAAEEGSTLFVGGSTFVVADLLQAIQKV